MFCACLHARGSLQACWSSFCFSHLKWSNGARWRLRPHPFLKDHDQKWVWAWLRSNGTKSPHLSIYPLGWCHWPRAWLVARWTEGTDSHYSPHPRFIGLRCSYFTQRDMEGGGGEGRDKRECSPPYSLGKLFRRCELSAASCAWYSRSPSHTKQHGRQRHAVWFLFISLPHAAHRGRPGLVVSHADWKNRNTRTHKLSPIHI